jgi:hypothetical protein
MVFLVDDGMRYEEIIWDGARREKEMIPIPLSTLAA